ncbi:MAG: hypothetical protein WCS37_18360 [Chloroflexota bacterium]|nr:hypothetical protein [Chloroflexota bacterium]
MTKIRFSLTDGIAAQVTKVAQKTVSDAGSGLTSASRIVGAKISSPFKKNK